MTGAKSTAVAAASRSERPSNVSVIIVCYQQGHFLGDAIESVLRQEQPADEILVVDDGSTDGTAQVAAVYPEVTYVWKPNGGLSSARNAGLERSRGRLVIFLDADDRLTQNAVRCGVECLDAHPECAFAYGDYARINAQGDRVPDGHSLRVCAEPFDQLLRVNFIAAHSGVIYRRDTLQKSGGFDVNLRACEDYDVYLRLARHAPIACHPAVVTEIRTHAVNMTKDSARMLRSALSVIDRHREPQFLPAWREGRAFWRRHYGEPLLGSIADRLRARKPGVDFRDQVMTAIRCHPRGSAVMLGRGIRKTFGGAARALLPRRIVTALSRTFGTGIPNRARFGNLRRLTPFSRHFGYDRGQPIDRYYIEKFLEEEAALIRGCVLEIGDNSYTRRFGGDRVTHSEVLNVVESAEATIAGDLTNPETLPDDRFDCLILTQTLHVIFDIRLALLNAYKSLRPGGHLLATLPGISQICHDSRGVWSDSWRLTASSAKRLFETVFGEDAVEVRTFGNVLTATAFLYGLASSELSPDELRASDSDYQMILCVRARKQGAVG